MFKLNAKWMTVPVLAAALLTGCGGNGNGGSDGVSNSGGGGTGTQAGNSGDGKPATPAGPVEQTISSVVQYINSLIANGGENTDPIDINPLTLAKDDSEEPAAVQ